MVGRFQNRLKYFQVDGTFLISRQFQKVLLGFNTGFFSFLPSKLRSRTYFHDSKMIQHFSQHTTTEPPHSLLSSAKTRSNNKKKNLSNQGITAFCRNTIQKFRRKKISTKISGFSLLFSKFTLVKSYRLSKMQLRVRSNLRQPNEERQTDCGSSTEQSPQTCLALRVCVCVPGVVSLMTRGDLEPPFFVRAEQPTGKTKDR